MATISNDDVEFEAREMLRERIERTAWFHHGMTEEQRQDAIKQDVDRHWPLFALDAAKRLVDRVAQDASGFCRKSGSEARKDQALLESSCGEQIELLRE